MDSREIHRSRYLAVWLLVSSLAAVATTRLTPVGLADLTAGVRGHRFDAALVGCCTLALVGCALWVWSVTSAVVVGLLHGGARRTRIETTGRVRRLVLLACGVALSAGLATPALATPGPVPVQHGRDPLAALLTGLPLPDRAVDATHPAPSQAPAPPAAAPAPITSTTSGPSAAVVVVAPGDSLWQIARDRLDAATGHATDAEIDREWREIYAANRHRIGADPDRIVPATRLRVPDPAHPSQESR